MVSVSHFKCIGRKKVEEVIGRSHWNLAPPTIDTTDKVSIGKMIFIFSVIEASGLWLIGPHMTAIEKRRE